MSETPYWEQLPDSPTFVHPLDYSDGRTFTARDENEAEEAVAILNDYHDRLAAAEAKAALLDGLIAILEAVADQSERPSSGKGLRISLAAFLRGLADLYTTRLGRSRPGLDGISPRS